MKKHTYASKEVVTINTDASYCPKTNTGGWGAWIKSDFFTIKRGGKFKGEISDSNESEIKALVNAFHILTSLKKYYTFKVIIINCDNATTRHIINHKRIPDRFKTEGNILLNFINDYDVCIAKHIRGHKANYNSRQWVNNWCDRASKQYRNELAR